MLPYLQTRRFAEVQAALGSRELRAAVCRSTPWRQRAPGTNLREYSYLSQSVETLHVAALCFIEHHGMTTYLAVEM
jgi:hypothetical protein